MNINVREKRLLTFFGLRFFEHIITEGRIKPPPPQKKKKKFESTWRTFSTSWKKKILFLWYHRNLKISPKYLNSAYNSITLLCKQFLTFWQPNKSYFTYFPNFYTIRTNKKEIAWNPIFLIFRYNSEKSGNWISHVS